MTLTLPMPPSVNNLFVNRRRGGRSRSESYNAWIEEAGWKLVMQRPGRISGPVKLEYVFEDCASQVDLDNRAKPVTDLLVTHRVIEGDGPAIVRHIDMRFGLGIKGVSVTVINLRVQGVQAS